MASSLVRGLTGAREEGEKEKGTDAKTHTNGQPGYLGITEYISTGPAPNEADHNLDGGSADEGNKFNNGNLGYE